MLHHRITPVVFSLLVYLSACGLSACGSESSDPTPAGWVDASSLLDAAAEAPGAETGSTLGPDQDAAVDAGCVGWTTLARLSPTEAANLMATSKPIVINVHIPYEGDIPGVETDIPFDDVDALEGYLKHDRCADLLLVCKSGYMSVIAGDALIKRGYLRVRHLEGGMIAWTAAGYPLLKDGGI